MRKSHPGCDQRGADTDTAKPTEHPHLRLCSVNTENWKRSRFNGCAVPEGWARMEANFLFFDFFVFFGGEGQSVVPGRPAWWMTSELHTLISSLLYQSLGVNFAPAFKLPDTMLRLCATTRSRDLQDILMSGVKGPLIKTLAHTVTPSL